MFEDYKKKFLDKIKKDKSEKKSSGSDEFFKKIMAQQDEFFDRIVEANDFKAKLKDAEKTINNESSNLKAELIFAKDIAKFIRFKIKDEMSKEIEVELTIMDGGKIILSTAGYEFFERKNDFLDETEPSDRIQFPQERGAGMCDTNDIRDAQDCYLKVIFKVAEEMHG